MALTIGTQLGLYEITGLLGKGGMGEVYRARDTKLKRDVALKVLPEIFVSDPARMIRFQREAEILASLNHPNIAHIYGVEERALAMELVEGDSPRGPMPFDDAWRIASQIADALEYAHDKGIVHRDLKPANVKVTPEGTVKLLDFGLAKAFNDLNDPPSNDPSNSPTLSLGATVAGAIVGTAAYMAPEQAKGKSVDKRADIWAWGVVFYELLTGESLHQGEDATEILAQVLTKQPDFERVPVQARQLLRECLQKDPRQRLRDIGDAKRLVMVGVLSPAVIESKRSAHLWISIMAFVTTVMAAVAVWGWLRAPSQQPPKVIRFSIAAPISTQGVGITAISRDGSRIAFVAGSQREIYVRAIDQLEAKPLAGTEDSSSLSFSPDGEWISYVNGNRSEMTTVKKVAITGGSPQTLASAPSVGLAPTLSWAEDGNIYFSSDIGLQRVAANGGNPEKLLVPESKTDERGYVAPQLLPDRRHVLVSVLLIGRGGGAGHRIIALDLRSGEKKVLRESTGVAVYAPTAINPTAGHLLYYAPAAGSVVAEALNVSTLQLGSAVPILEGVRDRGGGMGSFSVSQSGTLVYIPGASSVAQARTLVWVNREGAEEPTSCPAPRLYNLPRLSPDGKQIATEIQNPDRGLADIWICDLTRGTLSRLTSENTNVRPIWNSDGKRIFHYTSGPKIATLVSTPLDGGPQQVANTAIIPDSVSPGGTLIAGNIVDFATNIGRTVSLLSVENTPAGAKHQLLDLKFPGTESQFSPDGKFIVYQSRTETGRPEIYVRAYPGPGGKTTISTEGGTIPRWTRTGELFYRNGDKMMVVDVETSPVFRAGKPKLLFEKQYGSGYDVAADGKRFLLVKSNDARPAAAADQLNIVVNWFRELQERVPVK